MMKETMKNTVLRQQRILTFLRGSGDATIEQLCRIFNVSGSSIRRDLDSLEKAGNLCRVRGGATLGIIPSLLPFSGTPLAEMKDQIGKTAAQQVREGSIVYLGPGSTTLFVAKYLTNIPNLIVLVSHPKHAAILQNSLAYEVWILGGKFDQQAGCILGSYAEQMLRRIHPDMAIISCNAVYPSKGLIYSTTEHTSLMMAATEQAHKVIAVVDHSKFNRATSGPFLPFDRFNLLITNRGIDPKIIDSIQECGPTVQQI
jgi:DeoR family fructose operon transcriptional repressor